MTGNCSCAIVWRRFSILDPILMPFFFFSGGIEVIAHKEAYTSNVIGVATLFRLRLWEALTVQLGAMSLGLYIN